MLRFGNLYPDDECIVMQQNHLQSLRTKYEQRVSEFGSLSPCDTPGCPRHHTPPSSPSKIIVAQQSNNENSNLNLNVNRNKNPSQKRKENEDGFISPPLSKVNKRTTNATQLNFEIELNNKFNTLNEETARTSTENAESNDQNPNTTAIPQNLPPPVMLKINKDYHKEMKTITAKFPTVEVNSQENTSNFTPTLETKNDQLIEFLLTSNLCYPGEIRTSN
ncbi:hypothetical protein TNCV_4468351 [Trichonephila clavipes]|nr:hypothetical protein TNCV_4468351 [Trichonephila clavipes]